MPTPENSNRSARKDCHEFDVDIASINEKESIASICGAFLILAASCLALLQTSSDGRSATKAFASDPIGTLNNLSAAEAHEKKLEEAIANFQSLVRQIKENLVPRLEARIAENNATSSNDEELLKELRAAEATTALLLANQHAYIHTNPEMAYMVQNELNPTLLQLSYEFYRAMKGRNPERIAHR